MGLLANLWKLVGPTLPNGFCPKSFQELADALINGTQVTFLIDNGNFLYNYGRDTPAPENRIFPWYNTRFNRWYRFQSGLWCSPVNPSDLVADFVKLWIPAPGTLESALWSLDEGDGTDPMPFLADGVTPNPAYVAPTPTTGAMWMVVRSMTGRVPIGVGEIPTSDLGSGPASVGVSQPADSFGRAGEYAHLLSDAEGGVGTHTHPIGKFDQTFATADHVLNKVALTPTAPYTGYFTAGGGTTAANPETDADIYTLQANNGNGVTAVKHNNMQPYLGVYFITHTSRLYYTLPA